MALKASFTLQIEPFSINRVHYRDKRYMTTDYKAWQKRFFMQLSSEECQLQLAPLREAFDPLRHRFIVKLTAYYPTLLNKDGAINAHTEDLSNFEKPLIDLLFLPKFNVQCVPYGCPNLNADDRHIISLTSRKKQSPEHRQTLRVEIRLVEA